MFCTCERCNSLVGSLLKGADGLIFFGLRVSHKVPLPKSWSGCGRLNLVIRGFLAITKGFPHSRQQTFLLRMMHANRFLWSPKLRAQPICRTGRRLSVRTITLSLLAAWYHSHRLAWCPRLIYVHRRRRRQWSRCHRVWDICHWRHYIFTSESIFKLRYTDAKFMGPTWGPPGSYRPQMDPMSVPWTLLSGNDTMQEHTIVLS